ncbi:hypothetical protein LFYK43_09460 [Ligilactobacillus salitolerans]|uniref:UPF0342 protein LFYK43_09460 n=1 Tax=Ligilactobacillus salitolerans TaxID=1808352 RepID=A0A401ISK6_9LACO|nr:YlbF family regulator [Ligilactobacillus salitolerans]GBG94487.1 hypothetical protein LFYK43_09460 [Ligilactobacillus salitolerans]
MINIYDSANQLEQDLRQTQEYLDLSAAMAKLKAEPQAFDCFKRVQQAQKDLQTKQMQGDLSDKDMEEIKKLADEAQNYDSLSDLMQKEQALNAVFEEINKIIFKPVSQLYDFE